MTQKIEEKLFNLLFYGKINIEDDLKDEFEDEEVEAIKLLKKSAASCPELLWLAIFETCSYGNMGMITPALAAYLCSPATDYTMNYKIKSYCLEILETLAPFELLDLTEYIQSKVFGKGLGSRNQKIIRKVIEKWSLETLKANSELYPKELYNLIKIIHPRLSGEKGDIVKLLAERNQ